MIDDLEDKPGASSHAHRCDRLRRGLARTAAALLALGTVSCGPSRAPQPANPPRSSALQPNRAVQFADITEQAGIGFKHNNGARGKYYMPESIGSGCAFFDYDNDGWQDLVLINSRDWPEDAGRAGLPRPTLRLYRNNRNGVFSDVTSMSGLGVEIYGMGACAGDYDNDGRQDLYVTALGRNMLFHNETGKNSGPFFRDITQSAGVAGVPVPMEGDPIRWKWSTSAAWLDYDKDGRLDLFVCNYVKWSPKNDVWCGPKTKKGYCPPHAYTGVPCTLYRNVGGGKFKDVSIQTGIRGDREPGKSLGIVSADFNGDGWADIAVANDSWPNFLFINEGGKRFTERGLEAGVAFGNNAKAKAGMGIHAADWKNNGRFGLLIGNFWSEGLSLFENDGHGQFQECAHRSGMAEASRNFLTFGLFFFDYDLDGRLDAVTANGHIDDGVKAANMATLTYEERPLLFHNEGAGGFVELGGSCGAAMSTPIVGRGAAYADIDNDGDLDVLLTSNGRSPLLLRNDGGNRNHWIRVRLVGKKSNRDGIGAIIRVTNAAVTQSQIVHSGGSFLSDSQRAPTFGLGTADVADKVEVVWPSGTVSKTGALKGGTSYVVNEGGAFTQETRK